MTIEQKLIKEMNLSFSSPAVCKIAKSNTSSFVEINYVASDGELNHYCYIVDNKDIDKELKRISHNRKQYGVKFVYCNYDELTYKKINC